MDSFKLIAITPAEVFDGEVEAIIELLDNGYDRVHIRHPHYAKDAIRRLISAIPAELHSRLSLHDCHELAIEFPSVGIHLNARNPIAPANFRKILSMSCHALDQIENARQQACDYCFLSPIYDSISKPGYLAKFRLTPELRTVISKMPTIALGGVTPDKFDELRQFGFAGAAMLGAAWNSKQYNKQLNWKH